MGFVYIGLLGILNTMLLVLCWIPPILRLRSKILLAAAYVVVPLAFVAGVWIIPDVAEALGATAWLPRIDKWRLAIDLCYLSEAGFIFLALAALAWMALDISRRHHNRDLDKYDDMEEGA